MEMTVALDSSKQMVSANHALSNWQLYDWHCTSVVLCVNRLVVLFMSLTEDLFVEEVIQLVPEQLPDFLNHPM